MNNACQNMVLSASVKNLLGIKKVQVAAYCLKSHRAVKDPNIGCELCHQEQ